MNKWTRSAIAVLIAAAVTIPLFAQGNHEGNAATSASGSQNLTAPGTYPVVKRPITLSVFLPANPFVENFNTNWFTKWYEKKTNIKLKFDIAPQHSTQQKLNLVIASGRYPDMILNAGIQPTQQLIYGHEGIFIALNSLIQKQGVQIKKVFRQDPIVKRMITAPNGKIYALPKVAQCYHCSMRQQMYIYEPWLKKLGLAMPKTPAEFEKVLEAFKTEDPNGDGKADEIPLAGAYGSYQTPEYNNGNSTYLEGFLMNPFVYNDGSEMMLNHGKVEVAFDKPSWKQGLEYLHALYAKGLIYPGTFTQTASQLKQLVDNPGVPIVGAIPSGGYEIFSNLGGTRWENYVGVPPLEGPNGRVAAYYPYDQIREGQFVITSACKDPAAALRWADGFYSHTITMYSQFGRPGVDWRPAKKGEIGLNGKPASWVRIVPFGKVQNDGWHLTNLAYLPSTLRLGQAFPPHANPLNKLLYRLTKRDYAPYEQKISRIMPPMWFTATQAQQVANLTETIRSYVNQMTAAFITGNENINTGWNTYLKRLDQMGLKKFLSIYQTAYSAAYGK